MAQGMRAGGLVVAGLLQRRRKCAPESLWIQVMAPHDTAARVGGKIVLRKCRLALQMPAPQPEVIESVQAFMQRVAQVDLMRCPHCVSGMMCVMAAIAPLRRDASRATGPPP